MSFQNQILKANMFGTGMLSSEDRFSKVIGNHIPVMISDDGKLVCLPDSNEMTHIGVTGMTGKGKGILGNTLLGFEYWMKKRACCIFNDFQQETTEYSLPCLNETFKNNLKRINVEPIAYPMVYVYPSNKDLIIDEEKRQLPYLKMALPTAEVIRNIEYFYLLDASKKYLTANIDQFSECNSVEDVEDVLKSIIPQDKKFQEMKYKIVTIFKNIFDEMIAKSSAPDAKDYLTIRKGKVEYTNLSIQSLIYCKFIPSIQTSQISSKDWFPGYMKILLHSLYHDKYNDSYFKKINLALYVPEIDKMWKGKENGKLIKDELSLIGTNGRMAGIGMRWDAQDYDAIPDAIRANTKYLFVLRKSNHEEVNGIKKDFNVSKEIQDAILNLNTDAARGIFECVALTTDRFVIYNLKNGEVSTSTEPQKGRLLTPMAQHKVPGVKFEDLFR